MGKRKLKKKYKILLGMIILIIILLCVSSVLNKLSDNDTPQIEWGTIGEVDIEPSLDPLEELTFMVIDVGQGEALFIDYKDYEVLIDAGGYNNGSMNVVNTIKPYVDGSLDLVIGTHSHEDHIGGMTQIYNSFDVSKTIYGDCKVDESSWAATFKKLAEADGEFVDDTNTTIQLGEGTTLTLYDLCDDDENTNNNSTVCYLTHGKTTFLMSGDLEKEYEVKLRKEFKNINVYVLGHHGSHTSNSNLDVLKPDLSLISCGAANEYGHPHKDILEKAIKYSDYVYGTFKSGTMVLKSNGQKITYNMDKNSKLTIANAGGY